MPCGTSRPGSNSSSRSKQRVEAAFHLDQARIDRIVRRAAGGEKHFEDFIIEVMDGSRTVVAKVTKTVYVRKKGTPDQRSA
jgi:hypothetical protein